MFFHKSHDTKFGVVPNVQLNGKIMQRTYKFKYLGVILDPTMSFQHHYDLVEARMNSAIFKLCSIKRYVPELVMKVMFNAYVLSIYDYCIEVWCVQSKLDLNLIQCKINRFLLDQKVYWDVRPEGLLGCPLLSVRLSDDIFTCK